MHCYICDRSIDKPSIDARDGKFKPCHVCEEEIMIAANMMNDSDDDCPVPYIIDTEELSHESTRDISSQE